MTDTAVAAPDLETALGIYRTMAECRAFETRAQELFFEGLVRGTTHLGVGPGGGRRRRRGGHAQRRLDVLHLPRPQPHAGPRRADGADPRRAVRARDRPPGRQGRVDAPDLGRARRDGQLRDRRRPPADRARGRLVRPVPRDRAGRGLLLRRRDDEHRRVPRGAQHGRRLEGARSCSCARTTSTWSTRRSAP